MNYGYLIHKFKLVRKLEKNKSVQLTAKQKLLLCEKIYNLANQSFIEILAVPILVLGFVFIILKVDMLLTIKIIAVMFIIITVSVSISYIYVRNKLKGLLENLNNVEKPHKFSSIIKNTYIQFVPMAITGIMITGLILLAQFSYKYSDTLYNINLNKLTKEIDELEIDSEVKLKEFVELKMKTDTQKSNTFFYVTNEFDIVFADNQQSSTMFKEYFREYSKNNGGRVYENYGVEAQGVVVYTPYSSEIQAIGYRFTVIEESVYIMFIITMILIVILNMIILYYYARSLAKEINSITEKISNLNKEKHIGGVIAITSNDEIGLLQNEYNELQRVTQGYIDELKEKQDIIVKQGQLVSIGELAGGVAHDINTPISAIKTGIIMLTSMTSDKTAEEKEILQRMDNCATKIINIVNSMRNQIRNLGGDTNVKFKISDVVNDIKIITYHEISKNKSNIDIEIQDDVSIQGDPTKLGQVLTNLVVNAAQAYDEKGGKVQIIVRASKANAQIEVIDFAGGLDDSIAPYVFKNILTTKGTYGTGLGLYLAYSVIKGEFNGEITFDTKKGEGTTFHISIPLAEKTVEDTK